MFKVKNDLQSIKKLDHNNKWFVLAKLIDY